MHMPNWSICRWKHDNSSSRNAHIEANSWTQATTESSWTMTDNQDLTFLILCRERKIFFWSTWMTHLAPREICFWDEKRELCVHFKPSCGQTRQGYRFVCIFLFIPHDPDNNFGSATIQIFHLMEPSTCIKMCLNFPGSRANNDYSTCCFIVIAWRQIHRHFAV